MQLPSTDVTVDELNRMLTGIPNVETEYQTMKANKPIAFYTKKEANVRNVHLVGNSMTVRISQQYGNFSDFYIITAMNKDGIVWVIFLNTFQRVIALIEGKLPVARSVLQRMMDSRRQDRPSAPMKKILGMDVRIVSKETFFAMDIEYTTELKRAHTNACLKALIASRGVLSISGPITCRKAKAIRRLSSHILSRTTDKISNPSIMFNIAPCIGGW